MNSYESWLWLSSSSDTCKVKLVDGADHIEALAYTSFNVSWDEGASPDDALLWGDIVILCESLEFSCGAGEEEWWEFAVLCGLSTTEHSHSSGCIATLKDSWYHWLSVWQPVSFLVWISSLVVGKSKLRKQITSWLHSLIVPEASSNLSPCLLVCPIELPHSSSWCRDVFRASIWSGVSSIWMTSLCTLTSKLMAVLTWLWEFSHHLKLSKCQFLHEKVKYFGHVMPRNTTEVDSEKVEALWEMAPPGSLADLQFFLSLTGFHRQYI